MVAPNLSTSPCVVSATFINLANAKAASSEVKSVVTPSFAITAIKFNRLLPSLPTSIPNCPETSPTLASSVAEIPVSTAICSIFSANISYAFATSSGLLGSKSNASVTSISSTVLRIPVIALSKSA